MSHCCDLEVKELNFVNLGSWPLQQIIFLINIIVTYIKLVKITYWVPILYKLTNKVLMMWRKTKFKN